MLLKQRYQPIRQVQTSSACRQMPGMWDLYPALTSRNRKEGFSLSGPHSLLLIPILWPWSKEVEELSRLLRLGSHDGLTTG